MCYTSKCNNKEPCFKKRNVDKMALAAAVKCKLNQRCLLFQKPEVCDIKKNINNKLLFIEDRKRECVSEYVTFFDNRYICNCPVRLELYFKYKI